MRGNKITIKLTTPWKNVPYSLTPEGKGIFGEYKFEIDNDCKICDYWIVWGGLNKTEKVKCIPENVIYITDEAHEHRFFNRNFLQQFPTVFSLRNDVDHQNIKKIHEVGIWHMPVTYDEMVTLQPPKLKSKNISMVVSDATNLPGHKIRFAYANKLMGHFKKEIDFFGRGINPVENKIQALLPYKYSIAIENSSIENYFTEKIFECFLTYTMPLYYGCPNIIDYFSEKSFISIDINNFEESINSIQKSIDTSIFELNFDSVLSSRQKYIREYFLFPAIINFTQKYLNLDLSTPKHNVTLKSELLPKFHLKANVSKIYNSVLNKIKKL